MNGGFFDSLRHRIRRLEQSAGMDLAAKINAQIPPCGHCGRAAGRIIVLWPEPGLEDGSGYATCQHCSSGLPGEVRPTILKVVYDDPPLGDDGDENRDPWR